MDKLTIGKLQRYLSLKYDDKVSSTDLFMKLVEEVGETAEAINQIEGRKAMSNASIQYELADIIHYTVAIANFYKIDLEEAIIQKDKVAAIKYNQSPSLEEYLNKLNEYINPELEHGVV